MDCVYPWHQLAKDIAIADALTEGSELQIAMELSQAIQKGTVQCWQENGEPIRGAVPLDQIRRRAPHLTVAEGNAWLKRKDYLQEWKPTGSVAPPVAAGADYSILATRQELIDAYKIFTGMDKTWFANLSDSPKLLAARKLSGQGGRGRNIEPFFCPYAVMLWLIDKKRKKGRRISSDKAWEILEKHFPNVFNIYSIGDSRTNEPG